MKKMNTIRKLNTPLLLLLALGSLVALNLLARPLRGLRIDLTEDKVYTLSEGTRALLKGLERPVELRMYFSAGSREVPPYLKAYAARVEDLLREYARVAGSNLKLTVLHPEPLSDEEEQARTHGLEAAGGGGFGGDALFFGVVALSGARESALPFLNPAEEARLEYNLSRMVHEVTRAKPPRVGVYSPLPLFGEAGMPMGMGGGSTPPWLVVSQLRHAGEVLRVETLEKELPADLDTLLLVHPKGLDSAAQYRIDQYLVGGGRLVVLLDPLSLVERSGGGGTPMGIGADHASDLPLLLPKWGVTYDPGQVLGDLQLASPLTARETGVAHPLWLLAGTESLNPDELAVRDLDPLQFAFAGGLTVHPPEGVAEFPLVHASTENALLDGRMVGYSDPATLVRNLKPDGVGRRIATRLVGRFSSAFEAAPEGFDPGAHLGQGAQNGQVILVADADWIHDQMVAGAYRLMGRTVYEPVGDNLALFLNLVEQSSGAEELIALRSRGRFDRPFQVVNDLLRKAESASREEMEALQREIGEARERVGEIARSGDPRQRLGLDKALRDEQAALEDKIFQANRRLRDIERERRREVDALEFRLQALNLVAMPALVGLIGLVRGVLRKRRGER